MIGAILGIGKVLFGALRASRTESDAVTIVKKVRDVFAGPPPAAPDVEIAKTEAQRDVQVAQIKAGAQSWKDEYAVIIVSIPYLWLLFLGCVSSGRELVSGDFRGAFLYFDVAIEKLGALPDWYTYYVFGPVVFACLGIKGVQKVMNGRKK